MFRSATRAARVTSTRATPSNSPRGSSERLDASNASNACAARENTPGSFLVDRRGAKSIPRGPHSLSFVRKGERIGPPSRTRARRLALATTSARAGSPRADFSRPRERFRERVAPEAYRLPGRGVRIGSLSVSERSPWRTIPSTSTLGTVGWVRWGAGKKKLTKLQMMLGDDPFENSVIEHISLVNKAIFQAPAPSYSKRCAPHPPVEKRRETRPRGPDDPDPPPALAR